MSSAGDNRTDPALNGGRLTAPVVKRNVRARPFADIYHFFLTSSWPSLFALILLFYLATNAIFALVYMLEGGIENARPGSFLDHYFFSVQTMATIGYGKMVPHSVFANAVVALEALFGLLFLALATGLMFAKFSTARARVLFSRHAVIAVRDGVPSIMVRLANERKTGLVEATLRLVLVRDETTKEGEYFRRFHTLSLQRSSNAVFAFSWTAVHPIDEASPLYGATIESLEKSAAGLVATLVGLDEATAQTVHARHSWSWRDFRFDHKFVDILSTYADGTRAIDYARFHEIEPSAARQEQHQEILRGRH
jgi:inward rectifier potassium channel